MKNERIAEIKATLNGLGTEATTLYTNQEIVDKLVEFQAAMAKGVFEKTHAEHMAQIEALARGEKIEEDEPIIVETVTKHRDFH